MIMPVKHWQGSRENITARGKVRSMSRFSKYNIAAKYKSGFVVLCKCPRCETKHLVEYETKPLVMPRIFCEACKFSRYDSNEGSGYVKTKKAGRRAAA